MTQQLPVAFVSGHVDVTEKDFDDHYSQPLQHLVENRHRVVLGNAAGVDTMALQHLLKLGHEPGLITVYVFGRGTPEELERLTLVYRETYKVNALDGWSSYNKRDTAMTLASSYDVCWVRSEEECKALYGDKYRKRVNGTEQNVLRRLKLSKSKSR